MAFIKFTDKAIYWKFDGVDRFGDPKFEGPIEISVKWEDERRLISDSDGQERFTKSIVWYDPTAEIPENSFLARPVNLTPGQETMEDPRKIPNAYQVRQANSIGSVDRKVEDCKNTVNWVVV